MQYGYNQSAITTYEAPTGKKLVVEVDIKTREGFWGGDDVPTNDASTGLYTPSYDAPIIIFPVPVADVPVDIVVKVEGVDRTVYYSGLNSYTDGNADTLNIEDLVSITVDGAGVLVTDEGFVPVEDWMDDYVTFDWADGFEKPAVSNTEEGEYSFSVAVTTKESGTIYAATGTGSVKILVPEFTFNDTTVP